MYVIIQVEFSDDPGSGLLHLLNNHPNRSHFVHIFLQVETVSLKEQMKSFD